MRTCMTSSMERERPNKSRSAWLLPCLSAVFVLSLLMSLSLGSVPLGLGQLLDGLAGSDQTARIILLELRLPRTLAAVFAGMALSVAGLLLQSATNNDLCAPNVIGVNAGAGFAVMLLLCLLPSAWRFLPAAAFIGATACVFLVLGLSNARRAAASRVYVILAGVAVSALLNAGISFLSLLYPDVLSSYLAFSVGGFSGVQAERLWTPCGLILVCLILARCLARPLNLLCLGDDMAASLGVRVKRVRVFALLLAGALCAATVSFAGLLGFVGLIVPHMVRRIVGSDLRVAIPAGCLVGAALVVLADLGGRTLFAPSELPAGIFTAAIGAPFFLILLLARRRGNA